VTAGAIEVSFLGDGAQPAERTAGELAAFMDQAQRTLDIAIYDLNLAGAPADQVRQAFTAATARGVAARLAYNVDYKNPIPVPPPPEPDTAFIASLNIPVRPVPGVPSLMHHKYVVRDVGSENAAVWTGSTNWTNDSWTREENVILRITSPDLAREYRRNFEELWAKADVNSSGRYDLPPVTLSYQGSPVNAKVFFSPGRGRRIAQVIAGRLGRARQRIRVCSPVITAGPILGTLAELAEKPHVDFKGVYDRTQMKEVMDQWRVDPHAGWKMPAFTTVSTSLPFASKVTTPYAPGSVHDFMHAKITVVDDMVLTGSYNLSHSGEDNAENLLQLQSQPLADLFAGYIERLFARYAASPVPARQ
jgi:phosphatidylserine/phosphatidylglycerophosphate/cardiolipin synthase-like enzyme